MDSASMSQIFFALAEPTRREIIEMLAKKGRLSATDIYNRFAMSHPAVSQHLKVLRDTKLVRVEKHAQQRIYRVNSLTFNELGKWVQNMQQQWEKRFERLDALLQKEKRED